MNKTVNIAELTKELENSITIDFDLPKKESFTIARITMATSMMYSKMRTEALSAAQAILSAKSLLDRSEKETDYKKKEELAKKANDLIGGQKSQDKDYYRITDKLIKLILETNNYNYDKDFWSEITYSEKQAFIKASIEKDIEDSKKKLLGQKQETKV